MSVQVVLAGNGKAACRVLDRLLTSLPSSAVLAIAPPRDTVRSWQKSLCGHCAGRGVACIEPLDVNDGDVVEAIRAFRPALMLSVYYTQLFRSELLAAVDGPVLNFHPSLLPRHRGTAPLIWAIADGDATTGLSVHHVDGGIDTGRLVWQQRLPIDPDETGYELHGRVAELAHAAAADLLESWLCEGRLPEAWEQKGRATVHASSDAPLNHLDLMQPRRRVRDVARALAPPLPGAFCVDPRGGRRIVLSRIEPTAAGAGARAAPGTLMLRSERPPIVWCADAPLEIAEVVHDGHAHRGVELSELLGLEDGDVLG